MTAGPTGASGTMSGPFTVAGRRVDPAALRIIHDGRERRVEPRAMAVLVYLVERDGQVVSRQELEGAVWGGRIVTDDAVTNAVIKLRRALGDDARHPHVIETISKAGYRLIAEVAREEMPGEDDSAPAARRHPRWLIAAMTMVVLVAVAAAGAWLMGQVPLEEAGLDAPPGVAVLPFRSLGGERDWFSDGITADLVTDLSRVSGLAVVASDAAFAVAEGGGSDGEMAAELGVRYLVQGSVQRMGERVRVNAGLLDAASQEVLWAQRFDRDMADVFAIQDEVVADVVSALKVHLGPHEQGLLARGPETSVAAYEVFLQGLDHYGRRSRLGNRNARAFFDEAVALDPGFARARAGLALVYARAAMDGWSAEPARDLERAAGHAQAAAALDPTIPEVHFARGQVELFSGHHRAAIQAAQEALAIAPSYADGRALLAWVLHYAGRSDDALETLARATRNHPRVPASYREIEGEVRYVQGRYGDAVALLEDVIGQSPTHLRARLFLAAALARSDREEEAEWQIIEALAIDPDLSLGRLDFAFPFKDPAHLEQLRFGLRRAGLPE